MAFTGWPEEGLDFLEDLPHNNERTWWLAHKDVYDRSVAGPMKALLEEIGDEFGAGKLFRPNRDVRFSKDKAPYKTNCAAVVTKDNRVVYLSLSADGIYAGTGYYQMASDQLERFREAVLDDAKGKALEKTVTALEKKGYGIGGEALKTAPRGYPKDHPRIRFLRHKGLYCSKGWSPEPWLHTKAAKKRIVDAWRGSQPLCDWLDRHVGPTTLAEAL